MRQEIALFLHTSRKVAGIRVDDFCMESHVSTRTYYKIMKHITVKNECYYRLFIGISRIATYEEFTEQWKLLGDSFYWKYSED